MKYKYYGTAAAEGIPALWCDCSVCERARKAGGRNIMSRSQQIIDDKILIDFSADTFLHTINGLSLRKIRTCIVTHDHQDHFYPEDILMRLGHYAYMGDDTTLNIYCMMQCAEHLERLVIEDINYKATPERIKIHKMELFKQYEAEGYTITPMNADHDHNAGCVIYLIEKDGKCILHANDTGYLPENTWEYLEKNGKYINFATFDCTEPGTRKNCNTVGWHMNYPTVKNVRKRLLKMGLLDKNSICVVNHFSHNGKYIYDEICELVKNDGFYVSYDGKEFVF